MEEYARAETPSGSSESLRFEDLGLPKDIVESLAQAGVAQPTPFHRECIPAILAGKDVAGKVKPGIEEIAAFGPPIAMRVDTNRVSPQALVLTPTRERAQEIAAVLRTLGASRNLRVVELIHGVHILDLLVALRRGPQVVVGTPARIRDLLGDSKLCLGWVEIAVIDDADRMLEAGLLDAARGVLDWVPKDRQTLLFSAAMPPELRPFLRRHLKKPEVIRAPGELAAIPEIRHFYVECDPPRKFQELEKVLSAAGAERVLVFSNDDRQAADLDRALWGHGHSAACILAGRGEDERSKALEAFRSGEVRALVLTDAACEGLEVGEAGCVVHYDVPADAETYARRVARAKPTGFAIAFVSRKERRDWRSLLREAKLAVSRWRPPRAEGAGRAEGAQEEAQRAADPAAADAERSRSRRRGRRRGRRKRGERRPESQAGAAPQPAGSGATPEKRSDAFRERVARIREQQDKPQRLKLEEVGDDFVRAEYFNVDSGILERAQGSESPEAPSRDRNRRRKKRGRRGRGRRESRSGAGGSARGAAESRPQGDLEPPPRGSGEGDASGGSSESGEVRGEGP